MSSSVRYRSPRGIALVALSLGIVIACFQLGCLRAEHPDRNHPAAEPSREPPEGSPGRAEPGTERPAPEHPATGEPDLRRPIPGQVTVRFGADHVRMTFEPRARGIGLERLELGARAEALLRELGLARVRRLDPRLERERDGRVEVLAPAEVRPEMDPRFAEAFVGTERDFVLQLDPRTDGGALCERLSELAAVERCEQRFEPRVLASCPADPGCPDDPDFGNQWGFNNTAPAGPGQAPDFDVDGPEAWARQTGSIETVIAVIDSGVDVSHPDLYEKIWINPEELPPELVRRINAVSADGAPEILTFTDLNAPAAAAIRSDFDLTDTNANGFIDGDDLVAAFADGVDDDPPGTAGFVDDIVGWDFVDDDPLSIGPRADHGTAVAGLAGAMTDNAADVAGADWNARLLPLRAGPDAWRAVQYAIDRGVPILTSSLDTRGPSDMVEATLSQLEASGSVFSTSLGNIDQYIDGTQYARSPYTVAVSNYGSTGIRPLGHASSFSANTDVAGPGQATWSLAIPTGTTWFGGTSGANPIVAGVLSLMRAQRADLTPEQYRSVLRASAVDVPAVDGDRGENTPGFDYYSGWGLANADDALDEVAAGTVLEANITTQNVTYVAPHRKDELHVIGPSSEVRAFAGDPGGAPSDLVLEYAGGAPPEAGSFSTVASGAQPYRRDEPIATLDRSALDSGVNTLRLTVSQGAASATEIARVDVPRAYLDLEDGALITADFPVRGFAFHPDFGRYEIQVAPGHGVDPDAASWSTVGTAVATAKLPSAAGDRFDDRSLMDPVPLSELPAGDATLRVATFDGDGDRVAAFPVPVTVDETTFPPQGDFPVGLDWPFRQGSPVAYDLTGDGRRELIVTDQQHVYVFREDGSRLDGWPVRLEHDIAASLAVGDLTGDGVPEIVVRAGSLDTREDFVYVLTPEGTEATPWPLATGTTNRWMTTRPRVDNPATLADVDANGDLEILLAGGAIDPAGDPAVLVLQADGGVWMRLQPAGAVDFYGPPTTGDLDGDGSLEIVAVSEASGGGYELSIWNADGSISLPPTPVGPNPVTDTALGDLDGDGDLEIVILGHGSVQALEPSGSPLPGWESVALPAAAYFSYGLSLADLTPHDSSAGLSAIVGVTDLTASPSRHGVVVIGPGGVIEPAWSTVRWADHRTRMQPAVMELDGDAEMEILLGPSEVDDDDTVAEVRALNHDNTPVEDDRLPLYFEAGLTRTPAVADLDDDGDLEVAGVAQLWPGAASRGVAVYDLDAADAPGAVAWGGQRHDPQRTGNHRGGLRLLEPTTTRPSDVGAHDDGAARDPLLVRLRTELPHGELDAGAVTVTIGTDAAPIADLERVEGEDWLLVIPPGQPSAGLYDLSVTWNDGGIRRVTRMSEAIRYAGPAEPVDQVLVMDRSGSMLRDDKYLAARTAASFYLSARGDHDAAGVVSFFTEPEDVTPGMRTLGGDGSAGREAVGDAIGRVEPPSSSARTSIGIGLRFALEEVLPERAPDRARHLVLLSDGLENTPPFWDMGADPVRELFDRPANDDVIIHTIAIGDEADRDLHRRIAEHTGGTPRFVYIGSSLSLFGRLADAYKHVEDTVARHQRLLTAGEEIPRGATRTYPFTVPPGARSVELAISYRDPDAGAELTVLGPDGTALTGIPRVTGPSSEVVRIEAPAAGRYQVRVEPTLGPTEVLTTVSVDQRDSLVATLTRIRPTGVSSMGAHLLAGLVGEYRELIDPDDFTHRQTRTLFGFRPGLELTAEVVAPDGTHATLPLHDDGDHGDGRAGDGVYGARTEMTLAGGYTFTVSTSVPDGGPRIERRVGYFNNRPRDVDLDDILDTWEAAHFPDLSVQRVHPLADHDMDGLNTIEEFRYGTDPWAYDSDGDGRPDGSEVDARTDPGTADPRRTTPDDTDGDGLPDDWEREAFPGSTPDEIDAAADPDGDGRSTYTEHGLGTHPGNADTDHDGIDDGTEAGWRIPRPMERVAHPQPDEEPEHVEPRPIPSWAWWVLLLIVALIVLLLILRRA